MCRINSARNLLLSKMMKFFVVTFWVAARVYCSSDESSFYLRRLQDMRGDLLRSK